MDKMNVEEIMGEIRHDLAQMRQTRCTEDAMDGFQSGESEEVSAYRLQKEKFEVFEHLNHEYVLEDYQEMGSGMKAAFKKAIQKMVRIITVPLAHQQTSFNGHSVHAMNLLRGEEEALTETVKALRYKVNEQEQQLQAYQMQLDRMAKVIEENVATK